MGSGYEPGEPTARDLQVLALIRRLSRLPWNFGDGPLSSGCDDLLILHGGWDSCGDFGVECGAQLRQVQVTVDPAELLACFEHAGGAPAQRHLTVAPALDVGRVGPADGDHALD